MKRKDGRLRFLQECKRNNVLPRFVTNNIRTERIFRTMSQQEVQKREQYSMSVLKDVIRSEFGERRQAIERAHRACEEMLSYSKEDYLFTRNLKQKAIAHEVTASRKRLNKKLAALLAEKSRSAQSSLALRKVTPKRDRVICIDTELTDVERTLLCRGPKFVTSRGRLSRGGLRELESEIETMACAQRREIISRNEREQDATIGNRNVDTNSEKPKTVPSILTQPKIRKLRSSCQVSQPDMTDPNLERNLARLRDTVLRAYKRHKSVRCNTTKEEREAMIELKRKNVIIKCSDKSKCLVVMNRESYQNKVEQILGDVESYEESDMTADALEKNVREGLKWVTSLKNLPTSVYQGLFPKDTRLPEFYGLPKVHKLGMPLRPVVAAFGGPFAAISILMERMLNQLLQFTTAHIANTREACQSLEQAFPDLQVPENTIIVTMDVVALYPSIPTQDGIEAVIQKLEKHSDSIDTLGLSTKDIRYLLKLILTNNYFTFGEKVYRQKRGIAMGNHLAPPLAIIFMDSIEQKMLRTAEKQPAVYKRYVDDGIMVWTHGEEALEVFIAHCNKQHPDIRFTWDRTSENQMVSYMDMEIGISVNNMIEYRMFQKPSDSGVNLSYHSAIPMATKMAVAVQQFRRASMLSSNMTRKEESLAKIETLLGENGYPPDAVAQARRLSEKPPKQQWKRRDESCITLRLPFLSDELHQQVNKAIRKIKLPLTLRLVYRQGTSLKRQLVRSAFAPPSCKIHALFLQQQQAAKRSRGKPRNDCLSCQAGLRRTSCDAKGVVYSLKCQLCDAEYVGETKRTARARIMEHHMHARNKTANTPWGEHMRTHHPREVVSKEPVFGDALILAQTERDITRKVREAVEIRDREPAINRCKGWRLTV